MWPAGRCLLALFPAAEDEEARRDQEVGALLLAEAVGRMIRGGR